MTDGHGQADGTSLLRTSPCTLVHADTIFALSHQEPIMQAGVSSKRAINPAQPSAWHKPSIRFRSCVTCSKVCPAAAERSERPGTQKFRRGPWATSVQKSRPSYCPLTCHCQLSTINLQTRNHLSHLPYNCKQAVARLVSQKNH